MERESFIFYRSFYEAIKETDTETQVSLFDAICKKALYDEETELKGTAKILYTLIKPQLDANNKRYSDGAKGGRPKKTTGFGNEKTTGFEIEKPNNNVNENVNVNDNENIYTLSEAKASTSGTAKASKHRHGQFKNVLLKDEELQALQRDFTNWEELIEFLSEYIEMKGYKAKSHYLCIRKWVVEAVKERKPKQATRATNLYQPSENQCEDFSKFYI